MIDIKCPICGRLLCKIELDSKTSVTGEIKCTRCGKIIKFEISKERVSLTDNE